MTVNRIAWIDQDGDTDLRLGMPGVPLFEPLNQSFKKKRTPSKRMSNADAASDIEQTTHRRVLMEMLLGNMALTKLYVFDELA
ncbi:hypothetical protein BC332_13668 [Capsicum chinense]|nr:hypothetical protein BC332_13668 [Capsicum chinense]